MIVPRGNLYHTCAPATQRTGRCRAVRSDWQERVVWWEQVCDRNNAGRRAMYAEIGFKEEKMPHPASQLMSSCHCSRRVSPELCEYLSFVYDAVRRTPVVPGVS
jgi:hypothetical protein